MIEILDSPELRQRVAPISIERYHRMIGAGVFDDWQVELLNGLLVEKVSKSPLHQFLLDLLSNQLRDFCAGAELWVRQEGPLTLSGSEPEPDISVVEGRAAQFKQSNPTSAKLVIEVAISSVAIDRAKAPVYASAGIPEYWIVCPEAGCTEVYREPGRGAYAFHEIIPAAIAVESSALPGFSFSLGDVA
jgi:Uma2 family endonuclease